MHAPASILPDLQAPAALPGARSTAPVRLPSGAKQYRDRTVRALEARVDASGVARTGIFAPLGHNEVALSAQPNSMHSVTLSTPGLFPLTAITILTDFHPTSTGSKGFYLCSIYIVRNEITRDFKGSCVEKHKQQRHLYWSSVLTCQMREPFESASKPSSCSPGGLPTIRSSPIIDPQRVQAHPGTLFSRETRSQSSTIPRHHSTTNTSSIFDHFLHGVIFLANYLEVYRKGFFALLSIALLALAYSGNQVLLQIFSRPNLLFALLLPEVMQVLLGQKEGSGERTHQQIQPTQNGGGQCSADHERSQSTSGKPLNIQGTGFMKKRSVSGRKSSKGKSNDDESDGEDQNSRNPKRQRLHNENVKPPMFACPFYKHNAEMYRSERACVGPGWNTVHRVKEHLYRRHKLPDHQCPRCWQPFELEQDLRGHMRRDPPCIVKKKVPQKEGINKDQAQRLKSRKKMNPIMDEVDKWFEMYKIIFPEDKRPENPYYEHELKAIEQAQSTDAKGLESLQQRIQREIRAIGGVFSNPEHQHLINEAVNRALGSSLQPDETANATVSGSAPAEHGTSMLHGVGYDPTTSYAGGDINPEMNSADTFQLGLAYLAEDEPALFRPLDSEYNASSINNGSLFDPNHPAHQAFLFGAQSSLESQYLSFNDYNHPA